MVGDRAGAAYIERMSMKTDFITGRGTLGRRAVLSLAGGALGAAILGARTAGAAGGSWQRVEEIGALVGDGVPLAEGLSLELPLVSENGASVPLSVRFDADSAPGDPVETIHIFAPLNPFPEIAAFHFGPLSGRAEVATRIRLNESQTVIALARLASGALRIAEQEVRVTVSGCLLADDTYVADDLFRTRVRAPEGLAPGEAGEVLTIVNHPMETGLRQGADGTVMPKRLIERMEARLDGTLVFAADLNRSVAANPYLRFFVAPQESGALELHWVEDTGESTGTTVAITVG